MDVVDCSLIGARYRVIEADHLDSNMRGSIQNMFRYVLEGREDVNSGNSLETTNYEPEQENVFILFTSRNYLFRFDVNLLCAMQGGELDVDQ
jgi:hypothetical protein